MAQYSGNGEYHAEVLKISQFFGIPFDTVHVDRVSSLTQGYWTRKRKMLNITSLSRHFIPTVQFQRDFSRRFPNHPDELCTTTKQNFIYTEV